MAHTGGYDMVFVSIDLKNGDGLQICPLLRTHESTRQLPILLIANDDQTSRVAKGLDLGANDYLVRPLDANELLARTRTQLKHKRHYDQLRRNYETSMTLALIDPLTGAFNRRYLDAHLPKVIARSSQARKPLSILMVDVDHFKQVNDAHGHAIGDAVLKEIINRIMTGLRPSDLVARIGGEEFAVIMPDTDPAAAATIGERLRDRVAKLPVSLTGNKVRSLSVTISIGCSSLHLEREDSAESLLERADLALLKAKEGGRNRVVSTDA
jgi:two-component system cell cycle response regulator